MYMDEIQMNELQQKAFIFNTIFTLWTIVKQIDTKMRNYFKDFIIGGNSRR
jgi:hypothetical protein